jgi:thioesterase domain-containing protein
MERDCRHLESLLYRDIPITQALGLQVKSWEAHSLRLHAPLDANINHAHTMFGGSLYCIAVLAGWGWLYLRLREAGMAEDGHIVIQEGQITYPLPVTTDAIALCDAPDERDWHRFETMFRRRGRGRLTLHSRILAANGEDGVRFTGQYVLHR